MKRLSDFLDPAAEFITSDGILCFQLQRFRNAIESKLTRYRIKGHTIRQIGALMLGSDQDQTWMKRSTTLDGAAFLGTGPVRSEWMLEWRRHPDDGQWLMARLQYTKLMDCVPDCGFW